MVGTPRRRPRSFLTPAQRRILQLLAEGFNTPEAAAETGSSPRTISTHRQNILRKLHAHTATQAVVIAIREGYIGWTRRRDRLDVASFAEAVWEETSDRRREEAGTLLDLAMQDDADAESAANEIMDRLTDLTGYVAGVAVRIVRERGLPR